jgi:hypothetical protein
MFLCAAILRDLRPSAALTTGGAIARKRQTNSTPLSRDLNVGPIRHMGHVRFWPYADTQLFLGLSLLLRRESGRRLCF